MTKKINLLTKPYKRILFAVIMLFGAFTYGSAQNSVVDSLMKYAGNIHQFNNIFPQEKVYLQFDNTSYYSGETIWFKAFVVNASSLQRPESRVLYVDLISPDGTLLKQEKLMIVAGQADGSFALLDGSTAQARELRGVVGYPSGFYEIRAYTNYMQNFGPEALFTRVLAVYEKPKLEGSYYEEKPVINMYQGNTRPIRPETPKQKDINVSFFPEGGHLIIGQPNRVAFKVTGENGLSVQATGTLEDAGISFSTVHEGMGSFTFTPLSRKNSVKITVGDKTRSFSLPDAEQTGFSVEASQPDARSIEFTFRSTPQFNGQELGMTLTCRGDLVGFSTLKVQGETNTHTFDLSQFPEGVIRMTLFNDRGQILATRSFYHENPDIPVPQLTIRSDKTSYAPFEKIQLSFRLTDGNGTPFRDRFCLSVKDSRNISSAFTDDLRTNLLLSSDLKGFLEDPFYYFNPQNEDRLSALDLLCMVQGWEKYDWQRMAGVTDFKETFRLEKGLSLNGWILDNSGKKPVGNVVVGGTLMPQDKTLTESYSYRTDETGYFGFDMGAQFYDRARLSIRATPMTDGKRSRTPNVTIQFERSRLPMLRAYQPGENQFRTKSVRQITGVTEAEKDDNLPTIINVATGLVLPDVEIVEQRKFVDYYTFQAYDVVKDVEAELDKGNYSTDLLGYLKDKGYEVNFGYLMERYSDYQQQSAPSRYDLKLLINNTYAYIYAHTEYKYRDLEKDSRDLGDDELRDDPSVMAANFDSRDIKSIMIYDHPMPQTEAWNLSPLFLDNLKRSNTWDETIGGDDETQRIRNRRVYMVDILLKDNEGQKSLIDRYDRSVRFTTVDGYSRPYSFYSPEYPNGPIPGDVDYRRTLYWDPNVITDEDGNAQVEFYNSSITKHVEIEAAGITASGVPYTLDAGF